MKRLRFCMVPITAMLFVLLAMSFAWARVTHFRANVTPTVVKTGEKAYLVVELLNDQGQVDPFGYQDVEELRLDIASKLGTVGSYNPTIGANDKGVVLVPIDYTGAPAGTDTIYVTLKEKTFNSETGISQWNLVYNSPLFITIQQDQNPAGSVKVTDISLQNAPVEDEIGKYDNNNKCTDVTSGCVVEAGNPFIINLEACNEEPYNSGKACTKAFYQNADVQVYLVGMGENYKVESGNYAPSSVVYSFNGTFKNGLASIVVDKGAVTKAGKYKIYITTPGKKNDITGKNEAIELTDYYIIISPRQAAKVKVEVNATTADQTGNAWCWVRSDGKDGNQSSKVVAKLLDQYGNIADNSTGFNDDSKVIVTLQYKNQNATTVTLEKGHVLESGSLNCTALNLSLSEGNRTEKTFNVIIDPTDLNVTLDNTNASLPVNVYADYIVLNATVFTSDPATTFLPTGSGLVNTKEISNIISQAGNSTGNNINGTELLNSIRSNNLTFTFFGTNEQTVQVKSDNNGTIEDGDLVIENLVAGASNNSTCVWLEDDSNKKYLPKTCTQINANELVAMAKAKDITIYQIRSFRYFPNNPSPQVDFKEVTGDIFLSGSPDEGIVLTLRDLNATADSSNATKLYGVETLNDDNVTVNATQEFPEYTARVVDFAGNFANSTDLKVTCENGKNLTDKVDISGNKIYVTWSDPTVTESTCIFRAGSLTKKVTVHLDWSAGVDHVNIEPPSDYVLTNSKIPLVLSLRNADDTEYGKASSNYTIHISDPSLIRVYDQTLTSEIVDGDDIDWDSSGKNTIFIKTLSTAGDVKITIEDKTGTVTGTKTLHIVETTSTISSIITSPESLTLTQEENGTITATVKDINEKPLSGIEVSAESDNTDIATVSPATCTTDANGQCTFTVTAGLTEGTGHITLTAQTQSAVVDVKVEQGECNADHLNLCTTEEECTAAGGYWYDDACHETLPPQPVPTKPNIKKIDVSKAYVDFGEVAAGTGDTMEMTLKFPPYENPVDIYVGIQLPSGEVYVLKSDKTFTSQAVVPYAQNVTDAVSDQIFEFDACNPLFPAPEGTYYVYTLVVPAGTDFDSIDWSSAPFDLFYYSFDVSCGD